MNPSICGTWRKHQHWPDCKCWAHSTGISLRAELSCTQQMSNNVVRAILRRLYTTTKRSHNMTFKKPIIGWSLVKYWYLMSKYQANLYKITIKRFHESHLTFWVGFHRSQGISPLWGSSTGGWRIDTHKSPFCKMLLSRLVNKRKYALME